MWIQNYGAGLTGETPVQLANGKQPNPCSEGLAADSLFKGKLIIDVAEPLFLIFQVGRSKGLKSVWIFKNETPAQRFSFHIKHLLESNFLSFWTKIILPLSALLWIPATSKTG